MADARAERRWARWAGALAAVLALVALLVAIAIHTAPVRRYALRRAVAALENTLRIRLRADTLDYNLFALRVTLTGVEAAALDSPAAPFFAARRLAVQLGRVSLRPDDSGSLFTIDTIDIDGGRVLVTREANGRTNLPEPGRSEGEPEPLRFGSLNAPGLAIALSDASNDLALTLPAIDIALGGDEGRIELRRAGRLTRRGVSTSIHEVRGGLAFDGRNVTLSRVGLRTEEASLVVDGTVRVLVEEPTVTLHVGGTGDVSRLARWAGVDNPPRGDLQIDLAVSGPFSNVVGDVKAASASLQWRDMTAGNVTTSMHATTERVGIHQLDARVFGGRISMVGDFPLETGDSTLTASWTGIDIETVMRTFAREMTPRPTGRTTGSLNARGRAFDIARWTADASMRTAGGATGPGRVAVEGTADLRVDRGRWRLRAEERAGGVPMTISLGGAIDFDRTDRSTVNGTVIVPPIPTRAVLDLLRRTDIATIDVAGTEGTIRSDVVVGGTFGSPQIRARGDATLDDVGGLAPGTPLGGPAAVRFHATLEEARVEATLRDFSAHVTATIVPRAPYDATVDIEAPSLDLDRLLRGIDTGVVITGSAGATVHATGPLADWRRSRATLEVASLDARAGALPVHLASPAHVEYVDHSVDIRSLEIITGETRVSANGRLPVTASTDGSRGASIQITATGDLAQFTNAVAATGLVELPRVSATGPAALLARVTGSIEQPTVIADLELGPGEVSVPDMPPVTGVQLRAHADGEWIDVRDLTAKWQDAAIQATARIPIEWALDAGSQSSDQPVARERRATLDARISGVTPRILEPFIEPDTLEQIQGSIDASVHLNGAAAELEAVSGEVRLDRMEVRLADLPVAQRVPTRIALADGFARVVAWEWAGQGGTLAVSGQVRLSDQQAALLANGRFDLRMLTPFVRDAGLTTAGILEPRLSITGPLSDPRLDGDATVTSGEIRMVDPRVIATGMTARAVLTRTTAQITQLTGSVNGGTLSGRGAIAFAPRTPTDARLELTVDGMALDFPQGLRSELDAALGISLTVPAADIVVPTGSVTGTVTVVRSAYREPMAVVAGLLNALRARRLAATAAGPEPSLIDNLTLDVRVVTDDDVTVDNNLGRLQLGADVRVIGTWAAPSLSGRAELREGGRLFLGRNIYVIESGTVDFANPVTIEPDVNVQARTRAGGEDIVLTLKGTPETLESQLRSTSTPELGEADLVSLLLTGRRLDEVSGREGQIVGEQVLGYLSGDVLGLASRAVGLDTIRLGGVDQELLRRDPTAVATEVDPTTRLTFGKSLGRSVDVTYSQSLRNGDAQAWIVDYRPLRAVELRLVSDDDDLRSYEFRHDVSFGSAAGPRAEPTETPARPARELRVAAVEPRGALVLPERDVRGVLELGVGEDFDFTEWQRDRERLEALYRREGYYEARVDAQREERENVVTLVYDITPGVRTTIAVAGHELSRATLDRLRTAWTQAMVDDFLVEEARAIVMRDLAREGYLQARVEVVIEGFRLKPEATLPPEGGSYQPEATLPPEGGSYSKTLSIRIVPGPRTRAGVVTIDTADRALAGELLAWIDVHELTRGAGADPAAIERELTTYLRSRGYLRARVSAAPPAIDGDRFELRVEVEPGPVFVITDLQFVGAERLSLDVLVDAIGLGRGAPYDPAAVDRARERLAARYRREGFAQARVDVRQAIDDAAPGVRVVFAIEEGRRQVIRTVTVEGNRAIDQDVITRAMALPLNEPVPAAAWLQARRRVFDTSLFRRVDVTAEPMTPDASDIDVQPMRARVTVEEWPALRLRYGFQVTEERPEGEVEGRDLAPGLSADITRRTLFGRAVTVGGALEYQRRERSGRAFLNAPTLRGWPIESSLLLERSREEFTAATLLTDLTGVSWEQRMRVARSLRLSYGYRFERNHTFDTEPPSDPSLAFDITLKVARLNASAAFDTRDDPSDTSRGSLVSGSFDYAPEALGSEIRFARFLAQAYHFRPWRGLVLASAGRFGVAAALDDQDLIPSERFFAGGSRTVRGVREDGLGPRDFFGNARGGELMLVVNQEARFPIYRWLRGVGFLDAGNVFQQPSDVGGLVGSVGFGLRLTTPFALFRVDYGRVFRTRPTDRSARWTFGLGQAF